MSDEWLRLGEVARLLGVHPSTARSWSDQGNIPVYRTKGGHRRYRRSEMDIWMQSQRGSAPINANIVVQNMLRNTRFQIGEGCLKKETWYNKLDEKARLYYRMSGRTLLQGLIRYLNSEDEEAIAEAQALGYEYSSRGRRHGLSSVESANALLFFRNLLIESMLSVYEGASVCSPNAWSDMFRKINHFTDHILVKILETYAIYQKAE